MKIIEAKQANTYAQDYLKLGNLKAVFKKIEKKSRKGAFFITWKSLSEQDLITLVAKGFKVNKIDAHEGREEYFEITW